MEAPQSFCGVCLFARVRASSSSSPHVDSVLSGNGPVSSDGMHVGTVLGVEDGRLKLASGGIDHDIDIAMVDAIENDAVRLRKTAAKTVRTWH
jgi:hypothetical protein